MQPEIKSTSIEDKLLDLNAKYDQDLNLLSLNKQSINESQIEILKVKNNLLLLSDMPLSLNEKNNILLDIENSLNIKDSFYKENINQQLKLIKSIRDDLKTSDKNKGSSKKIEELYINFLNLENNINNDLNEVQINEYKTINAKIEDITSLLIEADTIGNEEEINTIKSNLNRAEIYKAKKNARILKINTNDLKLIEEEKKLILENMNFYNAIEEIDFNSSKAKAEEKVLSLKTEVLKLKSLLDEETQIIIKNTTLLNESYKALEGLKNSLRYGEYLITDDGLLISFSKEEEKIKNKILQLENKKKSITNKITILGNKIVTKDQEVIDTLKQSDDIEKAKVKAEAKIKRMKIQAIDLQLLLDEETQTTLKNNKLLSNSYIALEDLKNSTRIGKYVISSKGIISFDEEEEKLKAILLNLENKKKDIIDKINNLSKEIKFKNEEVENFENNILAEVRNALKEEEIFQAILYLQSDLELSFNNAEKELNKARMEGDLNKINKALDKKLLAEKKLKVGKSELAITENLEKQKLLEYDRDKKISIPSLNFSKRKKIQRQYASLIKKISLKNKKLEAILSSSINETKLIQEEDTLLTEFNNAEKELKKARKNGDLNKVNEALKKKISAEKKLKINRSELVIAKNVEKQKLLEYDRDFKLSHPSLDLDRRKEIQEQYSTTLDKLSLENKKLESNIVLEKEEKLGQEEGILLADLNNAEIELKEARKEGDLNKINKALKKSTLAKSKLKISRAEIAVAKNKEKQKLMEYDRDFKLSQPSLDLSKRNKIQGNYSLSIDQLNMDYEKLKNSIRSSINERKIKQNQIEYNKLENELKEARKEGDLDKINNALKELVLADEKLKVAETEITNLNNKKIEMIQNETSKLLDKLRDLTKENNNNKDTLQNEKKVFIKSGQVFSSDESKVFNGPSPKEKEALKKRIKNGFIQNVNVISNNLLIFHNDELIIIPMKDIMGKTKKQLSSVINIAFNPQRSLNDIRVNIQENINNNQGNTDLKSNKALNLNNPEVIKGVANAASKEAIKLKTDLSQAKENASQAKALALAAAENLAAAKTAAEKAAAEKAKTAADAAVKLAEEKVTEAAEKAALAATAKSALEAAEVAVTEAKASFTSKFSTHAVIESTYQDKIAEKTAAIDYYESLYMLPSSNPTKVAALAAANSADVAASDAYIKATAAWEAQDTAHTEVGVAVWSVGERLQLYNTAKAASDKAAKEAAEAKAAADKDS